MGGGRGRGFAPVSFSGSEIECRAQEEEKGRRVQGRLVGAVLAAVGLLGGAAPCAAQTLADTVERAVRTFPDLRAAQANRRALEETLPQARSQLLPSLDGTLGRGRE